MDGQTITLNINEVFHSVQGEGRWTGTPMTFVRFAGCNLRCSWCDQPDSVPLVGWQLKYDKRTLASVVAEIESWGCRHVCFTGGEPLTHAAECKALYNELKCRTVNGGAYFVHVETNGTLSTDIPFDWICVSPKGPLDLSIYDKAHEVKYIVDETFEPSQVIQPLSNGDIYLQPCNTMHGLDDGSVNRCLHYLKNNPRWKLSIQLHKVLGIR